MNAYIDGFVDINESTDHGQWFTLIIITIDPKAQSAEIRRQVCFGIDVGADIVMSL